MGRRVVLVLAAGVLLAGAAYTAYSLFWPAVSPEPVPEPEFIPSEGPLPQTDEFTHLARTDPVAMFEACLSRYAKEAKGVRATLIKRERVRGTLHDREVIRLTVRDKPLAVLMQWEEGAEQNVAATLYAEGVTGDHIRAWRPNAIAFKDWTIDVKGPSARDASRYCIRDSGVYQGMLRTYDAWKKRQQAGDLHTEYLGTEVVEQAGGRVCHVIRRTCPEPEVDSFAMDEAAPNDPKHAARDGATDITVFIDAERWLQVGTVLKRKGGDLLGEYYFRDVELVAGDFLPDTFTPAALRATPAPKK